MPRISSVHLSGDVLTPGGIIILPKSPFSEPSCLTTRCFSLSYQRETICPECRIRAKRQQPLHDLPGSALLSVLAEGLSCGPGHTNRSTVEAAVPLGCHRHLLHQSETALRSQHHLVGIFRHY